MKNKSKGSYSFDEYCKKKKKKKKKKYINSSNYIIDLTESKISNQANSTPCILFATNDICMILKANIKHMPAF